MDQNTKAPARRALKALEEAPAVPETTERKRSIPKRVNEAIDHLVNGRCKTIGDAAEQVGMARESLSRALSRPHIAEHLRTRVQKHLAINAARAGATKVDLLESENEMVRDRASSFILGLAGIQPATTPSVNLNIEMKAGYVIDLSEDPPVRLITRTIDHEQTITD